MKIKAPKDFWAGLMFMSIGIGFVVVSQNYNMGNALRMGPGYFPSVLGGLLTLLGLIVFVQSFTVDGERLPSFKLRPVIIVMVGITLFGVLIRTAGLVPAVVTLVLVSALGHPDSKWRSTVLLAAGLAGFAVAVFYYGLGLPFKLYPGH